MACSVVNVQVGCIVRRRRLRGIPIVGRIRFLDNVESFKRTGTFIPFEEADFDLSPLNQNPQKNNRARANMKTGLSVAFHSHYVCALLTTLDNLRYQSLETGHHPSKQRPAIAPQSASPRRLRARWNLSPWCGWAAPCPASSAEVDPGVASLPRCPP